MKKIHKEYIDFSEIKVLIEKKFSSLIMVSSLSIMICMTMISSNTLAWFTDTVSSTGNEIKANKFEINIMYNGTEKNLIAQEDVTDIIFDTPNSSTTNITISVVQGINGYCLIKDQNGKNIFVIKFDKDYKPTTYEVPNGKLSFKVDWGATDETAETSQSDNIIDSFENNTMEELSYEQNKDNMTSSQEGESTVKPVDKSETEEKENNESDNVSDEQSKDDILSTQQPDTTVKPDNKPETEDNENNEIDDVSESIEESNLDTE